MPDDDLAGRRRKRSSDLLREYATQRKRTRRWSTNDLLRQWAGAEPADDLHPDDVAAHYPTGDDAA